MKLSELVIEAPDIEIGIGKWVFKENLTLENKILAVIHKYGCWDYVCNTYHIYEALKDEYRFLYTEVTKNEVRDIIKMHIHGLKEKYPGEIETVSAVGMDTGGYVGRGWIIHTDLEIKE